MPKKKIFIVATMIASGFIFCVIDYFIISKHLGNERSTLLPSVIVWAILTRMWFFEDWIEKELNPPRIFRIGVWLLSIVVVPWYFLKYRGMRGGFLAIIMAIAVVLSERIAYIASWYGMQAIIPY